MSGRAARNGGGWTAAAASGLLLALAFPTPDLHLLVWVALVPLLVVARHVAPWRAWLLGLVAGSVYRGATLYWLVPVMVRQGGLDLALAATAALALILFLGGFVGLVGLAASWFRGRNLAWAALIAATWVSLEYVQTFLMGGFPWTLVGYAGGRSLLMMQAADFAGVYGLTFLVVLFNAAIAEWIDERPRPATALVTAAALVVAVAGYGAVRLMGAPSLPAAMRLAGAGDETSASAATAPRAAVASQSPAVANDALRVGLIQGNVPQRLKWDPGARLTILVDHLSLSRRAVDRGAQFVVWAESSVPSFGGFERDVEMRQAVVRLARQEQVTVLVGSPHVEDGDHGPVATNAAFLLGPRGGQQRYDKVRLVPFGEYLPLGRLPFVEPLVQAVAGLRPGSPDQPLLSGAGSDIGPFAVAICYEVVYPRLVRQRVRRGARFLVTITNDGWFGDSSAPYQHFAMARMRAVENRRWLLRAANTGITGIVDPWGRLAGTIGLDETGALVADVEQLEALSPYARWGDVFAVACLLIVVAAVALGIAGPPRMGAAAGAADLLR